MEVYLKGKRLRISPNQSIGKGGEADVFDIGGGIAVKIFKSPDHPDYIGSREEQHGAEIRLDEHQRKLPAFPKNMPQRVITPIDLAMDRNNKIKGYSMNYLKNTEPLLRFSDPMFRQQGIDNSKVIEIFKDLHPTVKGLHTANIVIGDFNDLNVLIKDQEAYVIDADSFQFGNFYCRMYTNKFVDPLLCKVDNGGMTLAKPFNSESDWYAYAVMLFNSLLYVDPYGGVYRPKKGVKVKQNQRAMHRITVFNPEVRYPKPATPFTVLPDELLDYFSKVFEKDLREEFPIKLLDNFRWTTCSNCGTQHAKRQCPNCSAVSPNAVKEKIEVNGKVTAQRIFSTIGTILNAELYNHKMYWLYHEAGEFKREDKTTVLKGDLDPRMRYRLQKNATFMAKANQMVILDKEAVKRETVDCYGSLPMYDVNQKNYLWLSNGQLYKDSQFGSEYIGDVLENQTLFWAGEEMGFGLYRAGEINVSFVFNPEHRGMNDSVKLPPIKGQLIDATCFFSHKYCWFLVSTQYKGQTINRCFLIESNGKVIGEAEAEAGDGTWLGQLRGKCAAQKFLLSATDDGIVRVEEDFGKLIEAKVFTETEKFVDSSNQLFIAKDGLYVVSRKEIKLLRIG